MDALLLHINIRKRFVLAYDCHSRHLCFVNWSSNAVSFARSVLQCLEWQLVHMARLEPKGSQFYTTCNDSQLNPSQSIALNWNALALHHLFPNSNNCFESFAEILVDKGQSHQSCVAAKICHIGPLETRQSSKKPNGEPFSMLKLELQDISSSRAEMCLFGLEAEQFHASNQKYSLLNKLLVAWNADCSIWKGGGTNAPGKLSVHCSPLPWPFERDWHVSPLTHLKCLWIDPPMWVFSDIQKALHQTVPSVVSMPTLNSSNNYYTLFELRQRILRHIMIDEEPEKKQDEDQGDTQGEEDESEQGQEVKQKRQKLLGPSSSIVKSSNRLVAEICGQSLVNMEFKSNDWWKLKCPDTNCFGYNSELHLIQQEGNKAFYMCRKCERSTVLMPGESLCHKYEVAVVLNDAAASVSCTLSDGAMKALTGMSADEWIGSANPLNFSASVLQERFIAKVRLRLHVKTNKVDGTERLYLYSTVQHLTPLSQLPINERQSVLQHFLKAAQSNLVQDLQISSFPASSSLDSSSSTTATLPSCSSSFQAQMAGQATQSMLPLAPVPVFEI